MMPDSPNGSGSGSGVNFTSARRRAFWSKLRRRVGRQCNELLPTGRVLAKLQLEERQVLGIKQVPIDRIVGSTGRFRDFDLAFSPLNERVQERWQRIALASEQGVKLPPVSLYKVGEVYFVEDGNHRLSVARAQGQESIEAFVIEFDPSRLEEEGSCQRLGYKV